MLQRLCSVIGVWVLLTVGAATQAPPTGTPGPKPGSAVPAFSGVDQFGRTRTLQSLIDREGLMLVFFRSADW